MPCPKKFKHWVRVKGLRWGKPEETIFCRVIIGSITFPGVHYNLENRSLHLNAKGVTMQKPFLARTLRPIIEAAILKWRRENV